MDFVDHQGKGIGEPYRYDPSIFDKPRAAIKVLQMGITETCRHRAQVKSSQWRGEALDAQRERRRKEKREGERKTVCVKTALKRKCQERAANEQRE